MDRQIDIMVFASSGAECSVFCQDLGVETAKSLA